jgi:hypothetical protein
LRPSFTLTATIAMQRQDAPVTAPAVSSRSIRVRDVATGVTETVVAIGGTLTDSVSHSVIAGADVSIVELGLVAVSRTDGRFSFGAIPPGSYALRAAKAGYVTKDTAIQAPGASVSAFDIALSPAP